MSKLLTHEQASELLGGLALQETGEVYRLPTDCGRVGALAKLLAEHFLEEGETLFFAHDTGVWPSAEIPDLFAAVRLARGHRASVDDFPGELLGSEESGHGTCLIACGLYFSWGFELANLSRGFSLHFDDDEW